MSVLVVGSVALDSVKTPFGSVDNALGGSCTYATVAARRYVDEVAMVGVVGEDFPDEHRELLIGQGVDISGLDIQDGKTFRWGGEYGFDLNTRETLFTELNVFADFNPVLPQNLRGSKYVFLANIAPELQLNVLDQMQKPDLVVLDTMNFWIEGSRDALLEVIKRVDAVLLNDEETRMLTGESNLIKAAHHVLEMGPDLVIVKKGEHGALVFSRQFRFSAPAYPVELLFDPTGAGDTFAGGFLGYLASTGDVSNQDHLRRAVIHGTVMASFTVEAFSLDGLAASTQDSIAGRYQEIQELARF